MRRLVVALLAVLGLAGPAFAGAAGGQDGPPAVESPAPRPTAADGASSSSAGGVKLITLDIAVPDSPALAALGMSPGTVTHPGSLRDLAVSLLSGVDRHGHLQSGLAIDFLPLFVFAGNGLTLADYERRGTRLLGRTQVSLATAKGSSDADTSMRAAVGLRVALWDRGDPRLDPGLRRCLDRIPAPSPPTHVLTGDDRDDWLAAAAEARKGRVIACQSASKARLWNASSFGVGTAPAFVSPDGSMGAFRFGGATAWAALALAIDATSTASEGTKTTRPIGQVVLEGSVRRGELVTDADTKAAFLKQDSDTVGARLVLGSADRAAVIEAELGRKRPAGLEASTAFRASVGAQIKVASDLWLSVAVGGERRGTTGGSTTFVLSSLKWAASKEAPFKPGQ